MNNNKQKLMIEYLISSPDIFTLCQNIVFWKYFDPEFRNSVRFIKEYYDKYNTVPNPEQIKAETDEVYEIKTITPDQIKYSSIEIETFCKEQSMRLASLALPKLIKDQQFFEAQELVTQAAMVSLTHKLGLRYSENIAERLERMLTENTTSPTGWKGIDDALFGGISRKELLLVSANTGGGKSITLANLAFNFAQCGKNVLYISLELSEDVVAQRFDTMFTGISRKVWKDHIDEITKTVTLKTDKAGIIDIIQMPTETSSADIRAYLKEFNLHYKFMPDLLILDYIDKMAPNQKVSADNVFEKDKRCSEQLRQIGVDYNMFIATASQLNRSAVNTVSHDHSHIAGGISKIHEADVYWSIIMSDQMKAAGKIIFHIEKTRNSDGSGLMVHLKWDSKYLRITDEDENAPSLVFKNKKTGNETEKEPEKDEKEDNIIDFLGSFKF